MDLIELSVWKWQNGRNGFAVSPVNENLIYAATVNTYVTYDGGVNWTKDNNDYTINQYSKKCPHSDVQDLKFNASGTEIWAASDGGPFMKNTQVPEIGWQNKVNEIGVAIIHYFDQSKIDPNYYVFGGYDVHSQLYDKNQIQYSWTNLGGGDGYGCAFDNEELGTTDMLTGSLTQLYILVVLFGPGMLQLIREITIQFIPQMAMPFTGHLIREILGK
jgi:hypothetical protein